MAYNVYSLPDCKSVLYHPDVGTANLHQCGMGKSVVSAAGDLTSHTTTADGYIVVNKLKTTNGMITLEVPQNSIGDDFLRRWARSVLDLITSLSGDELRSVMPPLPESCVGPAAGRAEPDHERFRMGVFGKGSGV